ncbi:7413_t:CDS:2, partial [Funneliformis geosporum]
LAGFSDIMLYPHPYYLSNNYESNIQGFDVITETFESGSSQSGESCEEAKITKKNKVPCKWDNRSTNLLLSYLKEHKKNVLKLCCRGSTAGKARVNLWKGASDMLREYGYNNFSEKQCSTKWKNMKQFHKVNLFPFNKNNWLNWY